MLAPLLLVADGCGNGGDGFRAEEVPLKAEVDKKIQAVKDNASIPAGAKTQILAGLEKQRETAK